MTAELPRAGVSRRLFLRRALLSGSVLVGLPILQACSSSPAPSATAVPPAPTPAAKPAAPAAPAPAAASPAAQPAAAAAASPAAQAAPGVQAQPAVGADVEAAKKEGKLVWYTTLAEYQPLLNAFKAKYPWVDVGEYLYLQVGKLYAKVLPEVEANVQSADVLTLSEIALTVDFQKKGHYLPYESPEAAKYDSKWKSNPTGQWMSPYIQLAGIGWNPKVVADADAPKTWQDLLDPKWKGQIGVKDSTSGQQYMVYAMITKLYGDGYWDKFAAQQPIGMPGNAQLFDGTINGSIKINACCQQSAYAVKKKDNAPVSMAFPKEGVAQIMSSYGIVKNAPHPNVAKLFLDWTYSEEGAQVITQTVGSPSTRPGAAPPPFMPKMEELNIWVPDDLDKFIAGQPAWADKWSKITGA